MSRKFQLRLLGEREPTLIVADTDEDAMCQMREATQATGKKVVSFFEVFEMPKSFERQFENIFA